MKETKKTTTAGATSTKLVRPKRVKATVVQQKSKQALTRLLKERLRENLLYAKLSALLPPQWNSTSQVESGFKQISTREEPTELELEPYEVSEKDNSDEETIRGRDGATQGAEGAIAPPPRNF